MVTWRSAIESHYCQIWGVDGLPCSFSAGPIHDLPSDFTVLKFFPRPDRAMWTFATCGMSQSHDPEPIELHMFSASDSRDIVELLVATAHFHRTEARLGLGHSINFGRPWLHGSQCSYGLVSLPYLDGPALPRGAPA